MFKSFVNVFNNGVKESFWVPGINNIINYIKKDIEFFKDINNQPLIDDLKSLLSLSKNLTKYKELFCNFLNFPKELKDKSIKYYKEKIEQFNNLIVNDDIPNALIAKMKSYFYISANIFLTFPILLILYLIGIICYEPAYLISIILLFTFLIIFNMSYIIIIILRSVFFTCTTLITAIGVCILYPFFIII